MLFDTCGAGMTYTRSPDCLWRSLNVSSAMPDLSRSPRPSAIMRSYCSFVARASGRSRPRLRASSSDYVKGAIHILFSPCQGPGAHLENRGHETQGGPTDLPDYRQEWCKDNEVRAALINSIAALSELLRGFNEIIYKNYIKPTQAG
jgi:hypothetical protein